MAAQDQPVSMHVRCLQGEEAALLSGTDLDRKPGRNHRGDVVLEREQVAQIAVVAIRPNDPVRVRLGELDRSRSLRPSVAGRRSRGTVPLVAGDCETAGRAS